MNYAEQLKGEIASKNAAIIAEKCEPNKEKIMNAIAEGIRRIGYVCIDTSGYNTSSHEGRMCGSFKNSELDALKEFVEREGFKVSRMWWGMSSNGFPDMLKITL